MSVADYSSLTVSCHFTLVHHGNYAVRIENVRFDSAATKAREDIIDVLELPAEITSVKSSQKSKNEALNYPMMMMISEEKDRYETLR